MSFRRKLKRESDSQYRKRSWVFVNTGTSKKGTPYISVSASIKRYGRFQRIKLFVCMKKGIIKLNPWNKESKSVLMTGSMEDGCGNVVKISGAKWYYGKNNLRNTQSASQYKETVKNQQQPWGIIKIPNSTYEIMVMGRDQGFVKTRKL